MKKILPFIIIIVASFFAIKPLFHSGFFPVHDAAQPERVYVMAQSLFNGMFPVRWVAEFGYGYGYPLFNFYAPLAYYIGAIFIFFGLGILVSTKVVIGLGILLAGISMYLFAKEFWGKAGGLFAALLYLYAPYHAVEVYVRGDTAEMWGYALIPFVFLGIYKLIQQCSEYTHDSKKKRASFFTKINIWIVIVSLSFAGVMLSHNLTAMMVTPFLLVFAVYVTLLSKNKLRIFSYLSIAGLLGLSLSAFYWIPVFAEMKYTNVLSQTGGGFDFHQHFVCWSQFWSSPWGYGGSAPGCTQDGLSFMAGKMSILFAIAGFVLSFLMKKYSKQQHVIWISTVLLFFSFFLSTEASKPIWEAIHTMSFFQFPWRFLVMISFFLSFLSGSVIWFIRTKIAMPSFVFYIGSGLVLLSLIFLQGKYFIPKEYFYVQENYFSSPVTIGWELSQASSEYMPKDFSKPKTAQNLPVQTMTLPKNAGKIIQQQKQPNLIFSLVITTAPTMLHINIADFPAWHIFIDGTEAVKQYSNTGINISLPEGSHNVTARFIQTPIEKTANIISLAGVIILFLGIIFGSSLYEKTKR